MANLLSWLGDRVKDVENTIGGAVNNVAHAAQPIGQGGINPLANAGQWAEQNVVKPAVSTGIRAANTVALPVEAAGAALTGQNRNAAVQQHLADVMRNSFITPSVARGTATPA